MRYAKYLYLYAYFLEYIDSENVSTVNFFLEFPTYTEIDTFLKY